MLTAYDYYISLHYLVLTVVDVEPQLLQLSQVTLANAEKNNAGNYIRKWV